VKLPPDIVGPVVIARSIASVPPVVPVRPAVIVPRPVPAAVPSRPAVLAPSLVTMPPAALASPVAPPPSAIARATLPRPGTQREAPPTSVPVVARFVPLPVESVVPSAAPQAAPPDQAVAAKPAPAQVALSRRAPTLQREAPAPRGVQPKSESAPLPFDAVLGTILYSPDRKLAIIDGRIVQPDDDVRGARVIDITPTAVLLRDAGGRLRRLTLGSSGR
jgi:hypothetical protein